MCETSLQLAENEEKKVENSWINAQFWIGLLFFAWNEDESKYRCNFGSICSLCYL